MYFFCYARSAKARRTASEVLASFPGEMIQNIDIQGPSVDDGVLLLIMPLEAAVKMIRSGKLLSKAKYPVVLLSADGRYVNAFTSDETTYGAGELLYGTLGSKNLISLTDTSDYAPDLTAVAAKYNMSVSDAEALKKVQQSIDEGKKVRIFTELNVKTCGDGISEEIFEVYRFPFDKRYELLKAYEISAAREEPVIFITCTKIPAVPEVPVLTPKYLSLGMEISGKSDSGYAAEGVIDALKRLKIAGNAISKTAASDNAGRLNPVFNIVSGRLGADAITFDAHYLRNINLPVDESGFIRTVDLCSAAAYAAFGEDAASLLYRRIDSRSGVVFSIGVSMTPIIL